MCATKFAGSEERVENKLYCFDWINPGHQTGKHLSLFSGCSEN